MSFFDDASLVMIPSGYKDQKVYSVKPTDGTGDLTFSRASSATRVQSNGLIEKVRTNVLTYSQTFSDASWLIGTGQTKTQSQIDPNGGTTAVLISNVSEANGYMSKALTLTANVPNTFSIYIKGAASGSVSLRLDDSTAGPQFDINYTTSWQRFSVTRTVDQASCFLTVGGYSTWAIGENIQFAFAQVETGDIATAYIPTTTAAVSVGPVSGLPRLDYLGSTCPRLLLEPQRSNLILQSENFTSTWLPNGAVTITANTTISPDGYQNADTILATGAFNGAYQAPISVANATQHTFSLYVKNISAATSISIGIAANPNTATINFNAVSGTINSVAASITASSVTNAGNGWYRLSGTYTTTGTTNDFIIYATGAMTFAVWGCQLEAGAYATSYIPTLGASVTRVADVASKTGISSLIGQTEGTLFGEFTFTGVTPLMHMFASVAGSYANAVYVQTYSSTGISLQVWNGAVNQVGINKSGLTVGQNIKFAAAYKNNDFVFYVNGLQAGASSSGTVPSGLSQLEVGGYNEGGSPFNWSSSMKQAILFKTRLTNAQLAELTA
jgi:hypothetical protein